MRKTGLVELFLLLLMVLLIPPSGAFAATDGFYQLTEVTAAWDGTDANRLNSPTADYDYAYGDEASVTYTLPWQFNFYGQSYSQINIDTNGYVWFGAAGSASPLNLAANGHGPVIAAWNNSLSSYFYGGVFVQHKTNPERVVIEWQTETYSDEGYNIPNDLEIVLFPSGAIRTDYKSFTTTTGNDFDSGISGSNGINYLNLTSSFGYVYNLADRSFQFSASASPAAIVDPYTSVSNLATQTICGALRGTSVTVSSDSGVVGQVSYPTPSTWCVTISGISNGTTTVSVTATDATGNQATTTLPLVCDTSQPGLATSPAKQISALYANLEIRNDGTLWTWGPNLDGVLGDGSFNDAFVPEQIGIDVDWASVSAGTDHVMALKKDGTIWGWGRNWSGQLGSTDDESVPTRISNDNDWVAVAAGDDFTVALKQNGTLWAWGRMGNGTYGNYGDLPVQIGSDSNWAAISSGDSHALALKTDGTLWGWGNNSNGQLGDGTRNGQNSPEQIGTDTSWIALSAGGNHSLALKKDGSLWGWGQNADGEVWGALINDKLFPIMIGDDHDWIAASAGYRHSLALKSDGSLWAWGYNGDGELGDGTLTSQSYPLKVGINSQWTAVAAGNDHSVAVKTDGSMWSWGSNRDGQLGDGSSFNRTMPVPTQTQVLSINGGAAVANSTSVTLNMVVAATTGTALMQFSNDNTNWSAPEPFQTGKTWEISLGGATATVYARFQDNLGNWSGSYNAAINTTTNPMVIITAPTTGVTNAQPVLNIVSNGYTEYSLVILDGNSVGNIGVLADGPHTLQVLASLDDPDSMGNAQVSFTVVAPPIVTLQSPVAWSRYSSTPLLQYSVSKGTTVVRVDGAVVTKASGSVLDSLADGLHTVRVTSYDPVGGIGVAETTFLVDSASLANNRRSAAGYRRRWSDDGGGTRWHPVGLGIWRYIQFIASSDRQIQRLGRSFRREQPYAGSKIRRLTLGMGGQYLWSTWRRNTTRPQQSGADRNG